MAIEKMEMMNLISHKDNIDVILKEMILMEKIHIKNALNEINENNFTLCVLEENLKEHMDMCEIKPYESQWKLADFENRVNELAEYLMIPRRVDKIFLRRDYDIEEYIEKIDEIYKKIKPLKEDIIEKEMRIEVLLGLKKNIRSIAGINTDIDEFRNMEFFEFKMGTLTAEKVQKFKKNYENISAIILNVGSLAAEEIYLVIWPKYLSVETNRLLKSLNFGEINIPMEFGGNPKKMLAAIEQEIGDIHKYLRNLKIKILEFKEDDRQNIRKAYAILEMERAIERLKEDMAYSMNFFYLSAWIPVKDQGAVKYRIENIDKKAILMFNDAKDVPKYVVPPTKLRNSFISKPFEELVRLYGVPSYKEMDPTKFLSYTYMIFFGAMFGDIGQGFVLLLIGYMLSRRIEFKTYGRILERLGLSSMVFGVFYGSIFGFETIIPALVIRPIENIDTMLFVSVVFGIGLLFFGFVMNFINSIKTRDLEDGLFGKNGFTGFLFYGTLISMIGNQLGYSIGVSNGVLSIGFLICILLMVFKKPISFYISREKPHYEEGKASYFIESGFEIIETVMSMLSNTISFIRIGAFALNHVGLFLAFETMANLINNKIAGIFVIIIGNIVIIGLEGLIVLIQGLRLEYYELFSKYFKGDGVEFNPVKIK